jgi:hypothetical protein
LLPRAERACREARQALEQAELHQRQVGPPSSIRDPELRSTATCNDEALAADQREWMREWEIRKEAEKAWWLATFLHDRRKYQLHKVRMAAWHEAERRDESWRWRRLSRRGRAGRPSPSSENLWRSLACA